MSILNAGGVRAKRGYPGEKYIRPSAPIATVNIHSVDDAAIAVAVEVFAVQADDCENTAANALTLLLAKGWPCRVEGCQFREKMGLFSMRLLTQYPVRTAVHTQLPYAVFLDNVQMPYVTAFSAESEAELYQDASGEDGTQILRKTKVWTLIVEELVPVDVAPEAASEEAFTLAVQRTGGRETYPDCRWETVRRKESQDGVHLVRIAKTWSDPTISE